MSIASSYYLGGHYGGQVADATMMREIRAKGPITVDLNVPPGFGLYKEGILTEDGLEEIRRMMKECNGESDLIWEYVNHSVAIIGWGADMAHGGMKFWICRNSYGTHFGEQEGHFRVRRGMNDFGIETDPVGFDPILLL